MNAEAIKTLVKATCPRIDFDKSVALIDDGILDSLQIMQLIMAIAEEFDVEIDGDDIVPENFNSLDAICALVMSKKA